MGEDAQRETIAFLRDVCARAGDGSAPMSTHISHVYFAGDTVYKLKRAVRTSYLDFSTSEKRLAACKTELILNRRTAPQLYRAVRRITREPDGLAFDGPGECVDAVVEMRRFDQSDLLDDMVLRGALTARHVEALARKIAAFHEAAAPSTAHGGVRGVGDVLAMNEAALRSSFLAREQDVSPVCEAMRAQLARNASLLDARREAGKVRRCHGDLTLRNIAMIDGEPTPFDCLEFDEALATIDVLYDLAFVLMDLWHRSRGDLANALLNRYLDVADESDGLALLPLFIAMRAVIRAHVTARMSQDAEGAGLEFIEERGARLSCPRARGDGRGGGGSGRRGRPQRFGQIDGRFCAGPDAGAPSRRPRALERPHSQGAVRRGSNRSSAAGSLCATGVGARLRTCAGERSQVH